MSLQETFRAVVNNSDIRNILLNPDNPAFANNALQTCVQYQANQCIKNKTTLQEEGFQIGEPWTGNIEDAPVLFLSDKPDFDFLEISPRYMPEQDKIIMPAHLQSPAVEMDEEDLKKYYRYRIQDSIVFSDNYSNLNILRKGNIASPINYWNEIREKMNEFMPITCQVVWRNILPVSRLARKVMQYAVCTSIIPFRLTNEAKINDNLREYCWNNFSCEILRRSEAVIFVIVGVNPLRTFTKKVIPDKAVAVEQKLLNGEYYRLNFGGRERLIISPDFTQGGNISEINNDTLKEVKRTLALALPF